MPVVGKGITKYMGSPSTDRISVSRSKGCVQGIVVKNIEDKIVRIMVKKSN